MTGAPRGRGWRTRRPPPSAGTQRRRRRRTGGGGGQETGGRGGTPPWERTREGARERGGPGSEETRRGRAGGTRRRRPQPAWGAARQKGGGKRQRAPADPRRSPTRRELAEPRGRTGQTSPGRHTVYHRQRTHQAHGRSRVAPDEPPAGFPSSANLPGGPSRGTGPRRPTAVARGGEPPTLNPHTVTSIHQRRPPVQRAHRHTRYTPGRGRQRGRDQSTRGRLGGGEEGGTTPPGWRARRRQRGAKATRRGNRGEDLGHRVGPPGKQAGSHRHTRGRSRTACDANPASGPSPGASHETRRPATTGWPSTRRDAPGLRTPACNATPRAGRVPRPGPLQIQGPLAHHPARGTLPGGPATAAPRASAHARGPPAGSGPGAGRGPLAAGEGERGTGPLNPRPREQSPTATAGSHTRHQRPTRRPQHAPGDPARPSGNPPPTRRGEARAAVGTKSRRSAPTRGGPADPCPPRRRGGGDSRLHTPPTVA